MPYNVIPPTGLLLGPIGSISQTDQPFSSARQVRYADTMILSFGEPFVLNADNTYSSVAQFIADNGVDALLELAQGNPTEPFGIAASAAITNTYYRMNGGVRMPLGFYPPGVMVNGLTRGTITVAVNQGTPAGANSPVYIRTVANPSIPAGIVGLFEAAADGSNTLLVKNMVFKTGITSVDQLTGLTAAQLSIIDRRIL